MALSPRSASQSLYRPVAIRIDNSRFAPLPRRESVMWPVVAALLMLGNGCGENSAPVTSPAETLPLARAALKNKDFATALRLAGQIPESTDRWGAAQLICGEAAARSGQAEAALKHYLAASRDSDTAVSAQGHFYAAETLRGLGRLADAETEYRAALRDDPRNAAVHERLAFLLGVTGRSWESLPDYWFLARSGSADMTELVMLADLDRPVEQRAFLEECARKTPDDHIVQLGLAVHAFWEGHQDQAERQLRRFLADHPRYLAAQAILGELLIDREGADFLNWHESLPETASEHADIWLVRGLYARRREQPAVAVHCFWRALQLVPVHRRATYHLGQTLVALNESSGSAFVRRAEQMSQLAQVLEDVVRTDSKQEDPFRKAAELLEQMGRVWETCAWALNAERRFPEGQWPREILRRLAGRLNETLPLTIDSANLALRYDLSSFPDHRRLFAGDDPRAALQKPAEPGGPRRRIQPTKTAIRFVDQAAEAGLEFVYYNGPDPSTRGVRMFEQTGGGVAAFDFDGDGLPDLYFTQGTEWAHGAKAPTPTGLYEDRLYRNLGDRFADVSHAAELTERDFGQGCTVGDLDNDGFPDLYVANIGRNRLHHNNGDGTFTDVTARLADNHDTWTASCVIVDLNADGMPDLFDTTYVTAADVYERICNGFGCSPRVFDGIPDRLRISQADGTFASASIQADTSLSKGLGVVAVDLDRSGRPCLMIANDQVPNSLLRNSSADDPFNVRLHDDGFLLGIAFNADGLAMASMGIAADDANGDGLLDFFVTTFKDESATLYLQDASGLFTDGTKATGLRAATWPYVGWGTQFLDADLDGEPDLVVANGHVDDYREQGGEYHMRPQFFRNLGGARFAELFADEIGAWFDGKYLGRGLARLDWNGDGRMDFAVSNIGQPAALVTNQSGGPGRFLNVRLHATATARDAIGAIVSVAAKGRRWTKQLVAGDGYLASNERLLPFGLADADSVREVVVQWPSGISTTLRDVPVDVTLVLVEGSLQAYLRSRVRTVSVPAEISQ